MFDPSEMTIAEQIEFYKQHPGDSPMNYTAKIEGDRRSHSAEKWRERIDVVDECIAFGKGPRDVAKAWGTSTAYVHAVLGERYPYRLKSLRNVIHGRAQPEFERNRRFFLYWAFFGYPDALSLFISHGALKSWINKNGGRQAAEDWCYLNDLSPEACRYHAGNALYNVAQIISK